MVLGAAAHKAFSVLLVRSRCVFAASPLYMRSGRSRCSRRPGRGRSTYVRYEHTDFFSTDEASDFVENEVRVGMTFRR